MCHPSRNCSMIFDSSVQIPKIGVDFAILASMKKWRRMCLLLFGLLPLLASAQELYENRIFEENIKTATLYPLNYPFGTPIIQMNTLDVLLLQFDEIGTDVSDFRYAVVQCDYKWSPTNVSTFDYIDGFAEGFVNDYDFSFNTTVDYVNYQLRMPNADFKITQAGNYAIVIYKDEIDKPSLTKRFMVSSAKVEINGGVAVTRNPSLRDRFQEIVFDINHEGFVVNNPFQEITVVVTQNERWDNAIMGIKPLHINENQLLFNYNMKIAFPSAREYREMDIRTLRYRTEGVRAIDIRDSSNIVYLMPDPIRHMEDYRQEGDLNGKYLIDRQEGRHSNLESDYVTVHFQLPFQANLSNGTFYVVGAFNEYNLSEENRMLYNKPEEAYETSIYLKQGFYNYMYVFVEDGQDFKDHSLAEGNYYDTENDYTVYVYYRPFGQRYDELIGYTFFNSKLTRY